MSKTTIGTAIYKDLEKNEYLNELYDAILYNYGLQLFGLKQLTAKKINVRDALRFADILSKSIDPEKAEIHKLWGQEIAALLGALYPKDEEVEYYLGSVLTNVSNFRGVTLREKATEHKYVSGELFEKLFTEYSKEYLRIPASPDKFFFRAQKEIYDRFDAPYFSYSAPTSLGKSYVMRMFIKERICSGVAANYAVIVPTKALINEVSKSLTEDLKENLYGHDYRIVTSAGAVALEEPHNYIFVMTPERLLYLLILMRDIPIEYLFIDEAHKISKKDGRSAFYYKVVDMVFRREHKPHIIFASPNVPNPEVYLQLIPEIEDGESYKTSTRFSPVNQEKFMIDLKDHKLYMYNESTQKLTPYGKFDESKEFLDFVEEIGQGSRNIVYSNNKDDVISYALDFAKRFKDINDSDLQALADDIEQEVHGKYYLAKIITRGVAYHMGYLPSNIRIRIEELYKVGKIHTLFCTSTLLEGVNLPADNLFITSSKNGGDMSAVDFRNLMGRVGRIEFNLYGNVFLVCIKYRTNKKRYLTLLQQEITPQQLSIVSALSEEQKQTIVNTLKSGSAELPHEICADEEEYSMVRKFANILLRDIVKKRDSRVRREFAEYITPEIEGLITENFANRENAPDDDINLTLDQTEKLAQAIRGGLKYPAINVGGSADYNTLLHFLEKLLDIFKWDVYESSTLGFYNQKKQKYTKLSHYAFVLNQWVSGRGLGAMIADAIKHDTANPNATVKVGGKYVPFQPIPEHINAMIAALLEDIENVITFRLSNYFLRFSQEYRRIYPDQPFMDWYEFVEYGCTNPTIIWLQRNGFTREAATYIREKNSLYLMRDEDDKIRLKRNLFQCENQSVRREAEQAYYNSPEIFSD